MVHDTAVCDGSGLIAVRGLDGESDDAACYGCPACTPPRGLPALLGQLSDVDLDQLLVDHMRNGLTLLAEKRRRVA